MRPNPRKPKGGFAWLAVDQNHVRLDMAIAEALIGSGEGVVAVFDR